MSNSLVFYLDRYGVVHIVDPDAVPHFDEHPPLLEIVVAVIKAGYVGVVLDEERLANGRFMHCLSVVLGTPEGNVIQDLVADSDAGKTLPSADSVLTQIKVLYEENR